jgi:DNA-binding FadR family transcriptional regulator
MCARLADTTGLPKQTCPAPGKNRVDDVQIAISRMIEGGELSVGQRLPAENDLARRFGVSRPVIREAIGRLAARGTIRTERGKGSFVQPPELLQKLTLHPITSVDDLLAFQELRIAIEQEAGYLAATRRTDDELKRIVDLNDRMSSSTADYSYGGQLDSEFHVAIADATHNAVILAAQKALSTHTKQWISTVSLTVHDPETARNEYRLREHEAIIDAIRRMDADATALAIRRHIENGRTRFLAHMSKQRASPPRA